VKQGEKIWTFIWWNQSQLHRPPFRRTVRSRYSPNFNCKIRTVSRSGDYIYKRFNR